MVSSKFCGSIVIVGLAVFAALLPQLMRALLRHMFTAPHQEPWPHGSLRLINVNGMPAQALNSAERANDLLDSTKFQHRSDDLWVVSYVKSGTTWTIGMLAGLYNHPARYYAGNLQKTTRTFCPQPELPDLGWRDDGFGHSLQELNDWPSPRCFKSHWPSRDHVAPNGKSKFIYVMRNPKDQILSHWNQVWGMGFHYGTQNQTFEGGFDDFFDNWINGNVENGNWFDHVASWYARSIRNGTSWYEYARSLIDPSDDVLWLRYEEMKADPRTAVERIAKFANVPVDDKTVTLVVNWTEFETMRLADQQDIGLKFMRFLGVLRTTHIRQGQVLGDSSQLRFSKSQLEALENEYEKKLLPLGMPRDWVFLDEQ